MTEAPNTATLASADAEAADYTDATAAARAVAIDTADVDTAVREHAAWRAARARKLREPHGWLSPTALLWPTATPRRLPGVPGEWWVADRTLFTRPAPGDTAVLTGERVEPDGPTGIGVGEGRSRILGTFLPEGRDEADDEHEVAVEVVLRTGRYAVRLRDPQATTRTAFDGVPAFDHDPAWVWTCRCAGTTRRSPSRSARRCRAWCTTWRCSARSTSPTGYGHHAGPDRQPHRADPPVQRRGRRRLAVADPRPTAPDPTAPDQDVAPAASDTLRLDLNRAENLPFAFTGFGTCPAPLAGNHLPFAVAAGEKAPR